MICCSGSFNERWPVDTADGLCVRDWIGPSANGHSSIVIWFLAFCPFHHDVSNPIFLFFFCIFSSVFNFEVGKAGGRSEHHLWKVWEDARVQPEKVQGVWRDERREHDGALVQVRPAAGWTFTLLCVLYIHPLVLHAVVVLTECFPSLTFFFSNYDGKIWRPSVILTGCNSTPDHLVAVSVMQRPLLTRNAE